MGQVLYRKYRSNSFEEVIGQDHIITTLNNALSSGHLSHAYLFTGPRGVGKTSVARILAHKLNNLDYPSDTPPIDIVEIDAASNRRIDEVRDLREKARILPVNTKYKVYIIDEVHMLTREAFNALLKTLEEPPAHVVFILATTEVHKLPETIISRTQRFTFRSIPDSKIADHLESIAKKEGINIDKNALKLIAEHGTGSFRDSLSLLDQVRGLASPIQLEYVQQLLGTTDESTVLQIITVVKAGDLQQLVSLLSKMEEHGINSTLIAQQLITLLRTQLIENDIAPLDQTTVLSLLNSLLDVMSSPQPNRLLELVLIEATLTTTQSVNKPIVAINKVKDTKPNPQNSTPKEHKTIKNAPTKITEPKIEPTANATVGAEDWTKVLLEVKKRRNTLYGILRMGEPVFAKNKITLAFKFPFHRRQVAEGKNSQLITNVVHELTGIDIELECIETPSGTAPPKPKTQKPQSLDTISNIFGSAEVIDS